jgi:hypothetical protein
LHHYLLNSPAWESLPGDAIKLLIDVWKRHNGVNNGEISYSCREAEKIGLSRPTTARMFDILIDRGFLAVVRNSCFKAKDKRARTWRITDEPAFGKERTKDFMRWRPDISDLAKSEGISTVSPVRPDSLTRETLRNKCARAVSPVRPSIPNLADSQSHQRDTYILPRDGRTKHRPLPQDWKPGRRATVEAKVEGLQLGSLAEVVRLFKERYVGSDVRSDDWLREFRTFVRERVQAEKQEADKIFGLATSKTSSAAGKGTPA